MPKGNAPEIGLALQGVGLHAAFAWGLLGRLLGEVEQGRLIVTSICATSGGTLNRAACEYGLNRSVDEARNALERQSTLISSCSYRHPLYNLPADFLASPFRWNMDRISFVIGQGMLQQIISPYATPWLNNPLASMREQVVPDFTLVNRYGCGTPALYGATTNVNVTAPCLFGDSLAVLDTQDPPCVKGESACPYITLASQEKISLHWQIS